MTTVGRYAFHGCESLDSVHIPNTVTTIGEFVFKGCNKLEQRQTNGTNYHPNIETWLRQRFDDLPIHEACYYANDTDTQSTVDLLSNLIQDDTQALAATDAMGMTALHILCLNPKATVEMVQLLVENDASLQERTGLVSPFMLAAVLPAWCGLDIVYALAMKNINVIEEYLSE